MSEFVADNPVPTSPSPPTFGGRLTAWVKGLLLFAPYAVLCGDSYRQGFASSLRIPESIFSWPSEQFVLKGCMALLKMLSSWVGPDAALLVKWLAAMAGLAAFCLLGNGLYLWFRAWCAKHWGASMRTWLQRKPQPAAGPALGFLIAGLVPFFVIIVLAYVLLPAYWVEQQGRKDADDIRRALADPATAAAFATALLAPSNGAKVVEKDEQNASAGRNQSQGPIYLIECDGDWCVVYQEQQFRAVPKNSVGSITAGSATQPHK